MKTELIILAILFAHWVADFVFQTDWQAKNKSKHMRALLSHTYTYSACMAILLTPLFLYINGLEERNWIMCFCFGLITLGVHTLQDYITSRINTKLYNKGDVHNFFVSVGFDQFLHFAQLILTYKLLF